MCVYLTNVDFAVHVEGHWWLNASMFPHNESTRQGCPALRSGPRYALFKFTRSFRKRLA